MGGRHPPPSRKGGLLAEPLRNARLECNADSKTGTESSRRYKIESNVYEPLAVVQAWASKPRNHIMKFDTRSLILIRLSFILVSVCQC